MHDPRNDLREWLDGFASGHENYERSKGATPHTLNAAIRFTVRKCIAVVRAEVCNDAKCKDNSCIALRSAIAELEITLEARQ